MFTLPESRLVRVKGSRPCLAFPKSRHGAIADPLQSNSEGCTEMQADKPRGSSWLLAFGILKRGQEQAIPLTFGEPVEEVGLDDG